MSSRILHSSEALPFPHNAPGKSALSLQVDQQIQIELQKAAERGMLFTRRQDSTPASGASHTSEKLYPQVVVLERKMKADDAGRESPAKTVTKRKRRSAKSNGDATPSFSVSKPGRPRGRASANTSNGDVTHLADHNESVQEPSTRGSRPSSPQTPQITTKQNIGDTEGQAIEVAFDELDDTIDLDDQVLEANNLVKPSSSIATRSRNGKVQKKGRQSSDKIAGVDGNEANVSPNGKKPEVLVGTATQATHKRFGSEDIKALGAVPSNGIEDRQTSQEDRSKDEGESEDEAPETVTASAGFDKARTFALDAAKVTARQEADKKLRRREHDQRLKLQAKSAKELRSKGNPPDKSQGTKRSSPDIIEEDGQRPFEKPKSLGGFPQNNNGDGQILQAKPISSGRTPLPLLLPEEILAAEPVIHAPKPSTSTSKLVISQKRKLFDLEPKPPKDMKRGNVTVRVLQDNGSILPPKSSQASKALRESWLSGRQVPRRKPSGGFVRRR